MKPVKSNKSQKNAGADHKHTEYRHIKGTVDIGGQIKAHLPPAFVHEYVTSSQKADRREDARYKVERYTLGAVLIVGVMTLIQTAQSITSANAAKSASDTAAKSLHISERAYISTGSPHFDLIGKKIDIPIINSGHVPSGKTLITTFESTVSVADPVHTANGLTTIEGHWHTDQYDSVPPGAANLLSYVDIPSVIEENFHVGQQRVYFLLILDYNDGFEGPNQQFRLCGFSRFEANSQRTSTGICDVDEYLSRIKLGIKFPANYR